MSLNEIVGELYSTRGKLADYLMPLLVLLDPIEGEITTVERIYLYEAVLALRARIEDLGRTIRRLEQEGQAARRDRTTDKLMYQTTSESKKQDRENKG
jgi:hypothetical protein